jgi:hypothetical protein
MVPLDAVLFQEGDAAAGDVMHRTYDLEVVLSDQAAKNLTFLLKFADSQSGVRDRDPLHEVLVLRAVLPRRTPAVLDRRLNVQ